MKIFVFGLPGSGKSTAIRHIQAILARKGIEVKSFNDYTILRKWFEREPDGPRFSRTDYDGFDIHDFAVFDEVLKKLEQQISRETSSNDVIIIEFARNDYVHALKQFSASFLQGSYFLFIKAEISTCKKRTRKRAIHRVSSDDHFVSDYIFDKYYFKDIDDDISSVSSFVNTLPDEQSSFLQTSIAQKITVIKNLKRTQQEEFKMAIQQFIWSVVSRIDLISDKSRKQIMKRKNPTPQRKRAKHGLKRNVPLLVKV
jgi:adenylate kinase family enzyme